MCSIFSICYSSQPQLNRCCLEAHPPSLALLAWMTPLVKMHSLGHDFIPDPIHAGGLRYHGMAPLVSHMYDIGELLLIFAGG